MHYSANFKDHSQLFLFIRQTVIGPLVSSPIQSDEDANLWLVLGCAAAVVVCFLVILFFFPEV